MAWRPFLLGPIFEAQLGYRDLPFNRQPARGAYMWRDTVARGIFGAPNFFANGELFFGNDRLEVALAWLSRPSR